MSDIQKRLETVINNFGLDNELVLKLSVMRDKEVVEEQRARLEKWKKENAADIASA